VAKSLFVNEVLSNLENSKAGTVCAGGGAETCAVICEEINNKKTNALITFFINGHNTLI
jgi:hypothetical protein